MKLHLPKSLRAALLACLSIVSPVAATLTTGTLIAGAITYSMLAPQAQADIYDWTGDNTSCYWGTYWTLVTEGGTAAGSALFQNASTNIAQFDGVSDSSCNVDYGNSATTWFSCGGVVVTEGSSGNIIRSNNTSADRDVYWRASSDADASAIGGETGKINFILAEDFNFGGVDDGSTYRWRTLTLYADLNVDVATGKTFNAYFATFGVGANNVDVKGGGTMVVNATTGITGSGIWTISEGSTLNLADCVAGSDGAIVDTGSICLNNGTLVVADSSSISNTITIASGGGAIETVTAAATVTLNGALSFEGTSSLGALDLSGVTTAFGSDFSIVIDADIATGSYDIISGLTTDITDFSSLTITGLDYTKVGSLTYLNGTLTLTIEVNDVEALTWGGGDGQWSGTGVWADSDGSSLDYQADAMVTIGTDGDTEGGAITLTADVEALSLTFAGSANWSLESSGDHTLTVDDVILNGTGNVFVNVALSGVNDLQLNSGSNLTVGDAYSGVDASVTDATLGVSGNMTLTGALNIEGSASDVTVGEGFTLSANSVSISGGALNATGTLTTSSLNVTGGTVTLAQAFSDAAISISGDDSVVTFNGDVTATSLSISGGTNSFNSALSVTSMSITGGETVFADAVTSTSGTLGVTINGGDVTFAQGLGTSTSTVTFSGGASSLTLGGTTTLAANLVPGSGNTGTTITLLEGASLTTNGGATATYGSTGNLNSVSDVTYALGASSSYSANMGLGPYTGTTTITGIENTDGSYSGGDMTVSYVLMAGSSGMGAIELKVTNNASLTVLGEFYTSYSASTENYPTVTVENGASLYVESTNGFSNYSGTSVTANINVSDGGNLYLKEGLIKTNTNGTVNLTVDGASTLYLGDQLVETDYSTSTYNYNVTLTGGATIKAYNDDVVNVYTSLAFIADDNGVTNITFDGNGKTLNIACAIDAASTDATISGNVTFAGSTTLADVTVNAGATLNISGAYSFTEGNPITNNGTVSIFEGASLDITDLLTNASFGQTTVTLIDGGTISLYEGYVLDELFTYESLFDVTFDSFINGVLTYTIAEDANTIIYASGSTLDIAVGTEISGKDYADGMKLVITTDDTTLNMTGSIAPDSLIIGTDIIVTLTSANGSLLNTSDVTIGAGSTFIAACANLGADVSFANSDSSSTLKLDMGATTVENFTNIEGFTGGLVISNGTFYANGWETMEPVMDFTSLTVEAGATFQLYNASMNSASASDPSSCAIITLNGGDSSANVATFSANGSTITGAFALSGYTVLDADGDFYLNGALSNASSTDDVLTKTGSGTLYISGDFGYTGALLVNEGTLSIAGTLSETIGAITLAADSTLSFTYAASAASISATGAATLNAATSLTVGGSTVMSGSGSISLAAGSSITGDGTGATLTGTIGMDSLNLSGTDVILSANTEVTVAGGAGTAALSAYTSITANVELNIDIASGSLLSQNISLWTNMSDACTVNVTGGGTYELTGLLMRNGGANLDATLNVGSVSDSDTVMHITGTSTSSNYAGLVTNGASNYDSYVNVYGTLILDSGIKNNAAAEAYFTVYDDGTLQLNRGTYMPNNASYISITVNSGATLELGNTTDDSGNVTTSDGATITLNDGAILTGNGATFNGTDFTSSTTTTSAFSFTLADSAIAKLSSDSGDTLILTGTLSSETAGVTITGAGSVELNGTTTLATTTVEDGASLSIGGTATITDTTVLGSLTIASAGSLTGRITLDGGSLSLSGSSLSNVLTVTSSGGSLSAGSLELNGSITYNSTAAGIDLSGVTGTISLGDDFSLELVDFENNRSYEIFTGVTSADDLVSLLTAEIDNIDGTFVLWTNDNGTITLSKDVEGILYFDATANEGAGAWEDYDGFEGTWTVDSRLVVETVTGDDITIDTTDVSDVTVKSLSLDGEGDVTLEGAIAASTGIYLNGGTLTLSGVDASLTGDITVASGTTLNGGTALAIVASTDDGATITGGSMTSDSISDAAVSNATLSVAGVVNLSGVSFDSSTITIEGADASLTFADATTEAPLSTSLDKLYLESGSLTIGENITITEAGGSSSSEIGSGYDSVYSSSEGFVLTIGAGSTLDSGAQLRVFKSTSFTLAGEGTYSIDSVMLGCGATSATSSLVISEGSTMNITGTNTTEASGTSQYAFMIGNFDGTVNSVDVSGTLNVSDALSVNQGMAEFTVTGTLSLGKGLDLIVCGEADVSTITVSEGGILELGAGTSDADSDYLTVSMEDGSTIKAIANTTVLEGVTYDGVVKFASNGDDTTLTIGTYVGNSGGTASITEGNVSFAAGAVLNALNVDANFTVAGVESAESAVTTSSLTGAGSVVVGAYGSLTVANGIDSDDFTGTLTLAGGTLGVGSGSLDTAIVVSSASSLSGSSAGVLKLNGSISYTDDIHSLAVESGISTSIGTGFEIDLANVITDLADKQSYAVLTGLSTDISGDENLALTGYDTDEYGLTWKYAEEGTLSLYVRYWGEGTWDDVTGNIYGTDVAATTVAIDTTGVTNATLIVSDGFESPGTMTVGGLTISGTNTLIISPAGSDTLYLADKMSISGTAVTSNADITAANGVDITDGGSLILGLRSLSESDVSLDASSSLVAGNITLTGGSITADTDTVLAADSLTSAAIAGSTVTVSGNATLSNSTLATSTLDITAGTLGLTNGSTISSDTTIADAAALTVDTMTITGTDATDGTSITFADGGSLAADSLSSASLANAAASLTGAATWSDVTVAANSSVSATDAQTLNVTGTLTLDAYLNASSNVSLSLASDASIAISTDLLSSTTPAFMAGSLTSADNQLNIELDFTGLEALGLVAGDSYLITELFTDLDSSMDLVVNGEEYILVDGLMVSLQYDDVLYQVSLTASEINGSTWDGDSDQKWSTDDNWVSVGSSNYMFTGLGNSGDVNVDIDVNASLIYVNMTESEVSSYTFSSENDSTITTRYLSVAQGAAEVGMTMNVTSTTTVESDGSLTILADKGDLTTNQLVVSGSMSNAGTTTVADTMTVSGSYDNSGTTTVGGAVTVTGSLTNSGTMEVTGDVSADAGSTFSNDGTMTLDGALTAACDVSNTGTLTVAGAMTAADLSNAGSLTAGDTAEFSSVDMLEGSTLKVAGDTTVTGDVSNAGTMTLEGGLSVTGDVSNTDTMTVAGALTAADLSNSGSLTIGDTADVSSIDTLEGSTLKVAGDTTVTGDVSNAGTMTVAGAMTATGTVSNAGSLTIGNDSALNAVVMVDGGTLTVAAGEDGSETLVTIESLTGTGTFYALDYTDVTIDEWESTVSINASDLATVVITSFSYDEGGEASGTLTVENGTVTITDAENLNSVTLGETATVYINGDVVLDVLDNDGSMEVTGSLTLTSPVSNGGTVTADSLVVATASFDDVKTNSLTLTSLTNLDTVSSDADEPMAIATIAADDSATDTSATTAIKYVMSASSIAAVSDGTSTIALTLTELTTDTEAGNYYLIENTGTGDGYTWDMFTLDTSNTEAIASLVSDAGMDVILGQTESGSLVLIVDDTSSRTWNLSENFAVTPGVEDSSTNTITPIFEDGQDAGVKNLVSYTILSTVDRVVIDESATIDLQNVVDKSSADKDVTLNNLSGSDADLTLTLIGDDAEGASMTLSNDSTTSVLGEVIAQDLTLNVESLTKEYTLDDGEIITSTGSLTLAELTLENTDLTVADQANFTVNALSMDADSTLAGTVNLSNGSSTLKGSYNDATVNLGAGATVSINANTASGLTLTGSAGTATLSNASGSTLAAINTTGASVDLGTISDTFTLTGASSMTGGSLTLDVSAALLGNTSVSLIEVTNEGEKLTLTNTVLTLAFDGTLDASKLTASASGQYTLFSVGEDVVMGTGSSFDLDSALGLYFSNASLVDGLLVAYRNDSRYEDMAVTGNGSAGLNLISKNMLTVGVAETPTGDYGNIITDMEAYKAAGNNAAADKLAAAVAGATTTSLGSAMMSDVERQLRTTRNRTRSMGVDPAQVNHDMPYYNAWITAEGSSSDFSSDSTNAGHKLTNTGGAFGVEADLTTNWSVGASFTALMGDLSSDGADTAEGDFDTMYASVYARMNKGRWNHSIVATYGMLDATLDRTVATTSGAYTSKGDTSGSAFGLMYEVGYTYAVTEDASTCIQPVFSMALVNSSINGYTEKDSSNAALIVGDQKNTYMTFGLGGVLETIVGENIYNRSSVFSARMMVKADAGERTSEADVTLVSNQGVTETVKGADVGNIGLEIGLGITIPVTENVGALFIDASCDLRSGMTSFSGTVGYRFSF